MREAGGMDMENKWKQLVLCLAVPLAAGGLSAFLSREGMEGFDALRQPPLSPPMWLFPVMWTLLFLMMGLASWLVLREERKRRDGALTVYGIQLFFNFFWSLLFFRWGLYFAALLWLAALWGLIAWTALLFRKIRPAAGGLLVPYLLWVAFAAYLNAGVWLLN